MQAPDGLAAETKRDVDQLAAVVSEELLVALAEAAEDDEVWPRLEEDAKEFLTERGIDVLDDIQIRSGGSLLHRLREDDEFRHARPQCLKSIQLYIEIGGKEPLKLPWLLLCVKWASD